MNEPDIPLSVRWFLEDWLSAVLLVLLVFSLLGGYVAYDAHINGADTVVEQRTEGTWTVESGFDHAGTVQRESNVFSMGTRLENRPLYFTTVVPTLEANYTLGHDNTDGREATASTELSLVIRAFEERDEQKVIFWDTTETLKTKETTIADGDQRSVAVRVNVSAVLERIRAAERDLKAAPGETEALIIADTTFDGTVAGESFTDTRTDRLVIEPQDALYRVSTAVEDQKSYDATGSVTRTVEPSAVALYGAPLLFIIGVLTIVGLAIASSQGWLQVTEVERTRHEFESERDDFDEWISAVTIPDSGNRTVVPSETMEDLVDIAIDSDRRVLEEGDRYAVIVDDIMYTYSAPTSSDPLEATDSTDSTSTQVPSGSAQREEQAGSSTVDSDNEGLAASDRGVSSGSDENSE
ncbi:DUF5305 domain-containing protein [Halovenus rubra]|uniref:DUF5305 domain-containing protein n=2 Tax=Halovenus rubra TaxID=869890 RepID=A0ABD5X3W3_9EURY|nr:DUF5305 domain-containing protein [Halovenus rubra]